jgi:hypothetical protein
VLLHQNLSHCRVNVVSLSHLFNVRLPHYVIGPRRRTASTRKTSQAAATPPFSTVPRQQDKEPCLLFSHDQDHDHDHDNSNPTMADHHRSSEGPAPDSPAGFDASLLPDFDHEFISEADLQVFAQALAAPDPPPSSDDLTSQNGLASPGGASIDSSRAKLAGGSSQSSFFITAQNDWAPVHPRSRRRKSGRRAARRSSDETREGYLHALLKWPLLGIVSAWVVGLGAGYLVTRLYIYLYEHFVAWRGKRGELRRRLQAATSYGEWVRAARELDTFLGNDKWKVEDPYAYYDHKTVKRVLEQIRRCRRRVEEERRGKVEGAEKAAEELKALIEACVRNNFVGVENARLYGQTYYGTKNLVQQFIDEGESWRSNLFQC